MQYECHIFSDFTKDGLFIKIKKYANNPKYHINTDAFVIFIMSHGYRNCIYSAIGEPIYHDELKIHLRDCQCKELLDRPKLVFIEACDGEDFNPCNGQTLFAKRVKKTCRKNQKAPEMVKPPVNPNSGHQLYSSSLSPPQHTPQAATDSTNNSFPKNSTQNTILVPQKQFSDMFIGFPTVPGYAAIRNSRDGSL